MHIYSLLAALSLLLSASLFASSPFSIPRSDGSSVQGYLSLPEIDQPFPTMIFIDGSANQSVLSNHEKIATILLPHNIGLISLEKRGISPTAIDAQEFRKYDGLEERTYDYSLLLTALKKKEIPGCSGIYMLLGASEGGRLACKLGSCFAQDLQGMVLIGAGGGMSFGEEMHYQSKHLISKFTKLQRAAYKLHGLLFPHERENLYRKMLASPDPVHLNGHKTWKWWASHLRYEPIHDLLKVDLPIYMIHGAQDIMVPVESADIVKMMFDRAKKTNLTYARYHDLGHSMAGHDDVYASMLRWIHRTYTP